MNPAKYPGDTPGPCTLRRKPAAIQIKPCPFCGHDDVEIDEIELGIVAICCPECQTIGPHQDGEQDTETAIAKWNDRKAAE